MNIIELYNSKTGSYHDLPADLQARVTVVLRKHLTAINAAPPTPSERLAYYERKLAEIAEKSAQDEPFGIRVTWEFINDGYQPGPAYKSAIESWVRDCDAEGVDPWPEVLVWRWGYGYIMRLYTQKINELRGIAKPIPGIARALADYITGTTDATLTTIIQRKRLPDGTSRPGWKGSKNDAARFAYLAGLNCHQFNDCFAHSFQDLQRQDIQKIKAGDYKKADFYREAKIYKAWDTIDKE